jgi:acyl carrier protein
MSRGRSRKGAAVDETRAMTIVGEALAKIAPEADLAGVKRDERLRDALDLDSIDFLSLVESLRVLAGVSVPEKDYPSVDTLDGLVGYLVAHATG